MKITTHAELLAYMEMHNLTTYALTKLLHPAYRQQGLGLIVNEKVPFIFRHELIFAGAKFYKLIP